MAALVFQLLMTAAAIALLAASAAFGGASTSAGGALLLVSLWCVGVNLGWCFHKLVEKGDDE